MVRWQFTLVLFLLSISVFAIDDKSRKYKFEPSIFEVTPLNSPVKEALARFKLKLPSGFEVDKVKVKLKDAHDIFDKKKPQFEDISVAGDNELRINVSKLPPGFYRLFVTVMDKKSHKEYEFKSSFHDYVRFAVDSSMEVPIPSEKENNLTLAGVDKDGDGIRDDIQRLINETFANKPNTKLAAKQLAKASQIDLLQSVDVASTIVTTDKYSESYYCMDWVNPLVARDFSKKISTLTTNTEARIRKSLQNDKFFHGQGQAKSILALEALDPRDHSEKDYSPLCDFNAQKEQ